MEKRARMASSLSGLVMFGCKTTIQNDLNYLFLAYTTVWACGVGGGGGPQNMGVDPKTWGLTRQPGKDLIDPFKCL